MNAVVKLNPPTPIAPEVIASLVITGDLSRLDPSQKVALYNYRCQQAGLDPAAKPFDLLTLNGKQILYANATCTQQLCAVHKLSTTVVARERVEDAYTVVVRVTGPDGRATENMGAVALGNLKGEAYANALMKAQTKAVRRTVLAHCGLGMLDETEVTTIPGATAMPFTADPRGDLSQVDPANIEEAVKQVQAALERDQIEDAQMLELYGIHKELAKDQPLYIAVADALAERKILTKAQWKDAVNVGGKLAKAAG
jgi:hypothetical protein